MPGSWVIGARADCDLVVDVAAVSGRHCRLTGEPGRLFLEDLRSTNGTFVNGGRLTPERPVPLGPDDVVPLGSHALDLRGVLARIEEGALAPLEFLGQAIVIGRSSACARVVERPMVSSRHARLFEQAGEILIEDLGSANGTSVNGKRIDRATAVRSGDTIGLGSYTLSLTVPGPEPSPGPQSTAPGVIRERDQDPAPGVWPLLALLAQA